MQLYYLRPQGLDDPDGVMTILPALDIDVGVDGTMTSSATCLVPRSSRTCTVADGSPHSDPADERKKIRRIMDCSTAQYKCVKATILLERGNPGPHQRTVEGELNPMHEG